VGKAGLPETGLHQSPLEGPELRQERKGHFFFGLDGRSVFGVG
jgi:hypothetical protein